jgi:nitrate reductase delta subunit
MRVYAELANLLDYPRPDLQARLDESLVLSSGNVNSLLQTFRLKVEQIGLSRLQELYIETFDFHAETSPYVGHHLFGEEIRRSLFMAHLRERYRESGLPETTELPDHLANVLRFLAVTGAGDERAELIGHCLIPALRHMLRALTPENPYALLLQAILLAWRQEDTSIAQDGEIAWTPFSSSSSPTSR